LWRDEDTAAAHSAPHIVHDYAAPVRSSGVLTDVCWPDVRDDAVTPHGAAEAANV
jgi:hypothetical protein